MALAFNGNQCSRAVSRCLQYNCETIPHWPWSVHGKSTAAYSGRCRWGVGKQKPMAYVCGRSALLHS